MNEYECVCVGVCWLVLVYTSTDINMGLLSVHDAGNDCGGPSDET